MGVFTHALSTNRYGTADLIVSTSAANGTHTTLALAMAAATSGQTIFLRDSVTENVTITPGVNIAAWDGEALNTPSITGTLTMTAAGTSSISGIKLVTNSAAIIAVTGSAASILNLTNCYLNCTNNTGITYSSSSASSQINISNCSFNLGTTGIAYWSSSSAGNIFCFNCLGSNTGNSLTASSNSAGICRLEYSLMQAPFSTTSTGTFATDFSLMTAINTTALTTAGNSTVNTQTNSYFASGTASAISVGVGTTVNLRGCDVSSANTNAITGAGAVTYQSQVFSASSVKINTTTQTGGTLIGGVAQAPSAGFLGEQITSSANGSLTSTTGANVTSISITAGIWDVSGLVNYAFTTSATVTTTGLSSTSATIEGTQGDDYLNNVNAFGLNSQVSTTISQKRYTLTATTTYYLVAKATFVSTATVFGRLTATRVG